MPVTLADPTNKEIVDHLILFPPSKMRFTIRLLSAPHHLLALRCRWVGRSEAWRDLRADRHRGRSRSNRWHRSLVWLTRRRSCYSYVVVSDQQAGSEKHHRIEFRWICFRWAYSQMIFGVLFFGAYLIWVQPMSLHAQQYIGEGRNSLVPKTLREI